MNLVFRLFCLFNRSLRLQTGLVLIAGVLAALVDTLGVASIAPLIFLIQGGDGVNEALTFFGQAEHLLFLSDLDNQTLLLISGSILVASVIFRFAYNVFVFWFVGNAEKFLSLLLLKEFMRADYTWFCQQDNSALLKDLISEVNHIANYALLSSINFISYFSLVLSVFIFLAVVDATALLFLVLVFGVFLVPQTFAIKAIGLKLGAQKFKANEARFASASEALSYWVESRVGGYAEWMIRRFQDSSSGYIRPLVASQALTILPRFSMELVGLICLCGWVLMRPEGIESERAMMLLGIFAYSGLRLMPALQAILSSLSSFYFAKRSLANYLEHFEKNELNANECSHASLNNRSILAIHLRNFSLRRPDGGRMFNPVNHVFNVGQINFVVGKSGVGKSSLLIRLASLDKCLGESGSVEFELGVKNGSKRALGYVGQTAKSLTGSVLENITLNHASECDQYFDLPAVSEAIRFAELSDFLKDFEGGLCYRIRADGSGLSGGQLQRINLAREYYRKPSVLFLDESTSALDAVLRAKLIVKIRELAASTLVIFTTHDRSLISSCDNVLELIPYKCDERLDGDDV